MASLKYFKYQNPSIDDPKTDWISYLDLILHDLRSLLRMNLHSFTNEFSLPELPGLINSYLLNSPRYYQLGEFPQNLRKVNEDIYKCIYLVILRVCTDGDESLRKIILTAENFFNFCGLYGFEGLITDPIILAHKELIDFESELPLFYFQTNIVLQDISELEDSELLCDAVNILYQILRVFDFSFPPMDLLLSLANIYENFIIHHQKQRSRQPLLLFARTSVYSIFQHCLSCGTFDKMSFATYKKLFKDLSLKEVNSVSKVEIVKEETNLNVGDSSLIGDDSSPVVDLDSNSEYVGNHVNIYNDDFEESDDFVS